MPQKYGKIKTPSEAPCILMAARRQPTNDCSSNSLPHSLSPIAQSQFSQSRKFVMVTSLADSAAAAAPPSECTVLLKKEFSFCRTSAAHLGNVLGSYRDFLILRQLSRAGG